jgi:hypothetical protein
MKVEIEFTVPFPFEDRALAARTLRDIAEGINNHETVRENWPVYGIEVRIDGLRI